MKIDIITQVCPGVWKITLDDPESITPASIFAFQPAHDHLIELPCVSDCPVDPGSITGEATSRGYQLSLPLNSDEQVYGLGLQLLSFNQRGKKKTIRVNSDPSADTGDSHAPVPFYVTTAGYGVLIDTFRYTTFYMGTESRRITSSSSTESKGSAVSASGADELYTSKAQTGGEVIVEIPRAQGADIYIFAGPDMLNAVQRYNLFSGGGCVPPLWGLGVWYRCKADFKDKDVLQMAESFRNDSIPCDVIGLEPGWQSHAYSCSHMWSESFPNPENMMSQLSEMNLRINTWTHGFTHPTSPIYDALAPHSGDYLVWEGLVPDFADPEARNIYADFAGTTHVGKGVSGYKVDECDNSDFISFPWSFPEISRFPSGLDGEQMHSAFGWLYQTAMQQIFDNLQQRTYGEVRSSYAMAAPMPYVLYSDLYEHASFIRGIASSSFSGILWCPEVRHAESAEDLIRRIQSVVFSPQVIINAWYIQNPPWKQWITNDNNADILNDEQGWVTDICRDMFKLRMRLLPYIYSAFIKYHQTGIPPFRALVMDYPSDPNLWNIDNQYMMGDRILVAPVVAGQNARDVYLPKGSWRDFWTGALYNGGQTYNMDVPIDRILVFVKDNSILPLAEPVMHTNDPARRQLTVMVYGSGEKGITLYEDDEVSYDYKSGKQNRIDISWDNETQSFSLSRSSGYEGLQYEIISSKIL
ncbi:MAG: glycoside hydrolase family 31 protein [Armatimonadota bacterium]